MEFRKLTAKEIDARVGICNEKGFSLLLYKDARCDMRILDEMNLIWQRKHYECKGNLYCSVGIWNDKLNQFVWKDDCGTESFTEKEKGEASDSFKRACFNWGIGRELYTAPFIYIKGSTKQNSKGQYVPSINKFTVTEIDYNKDGEICKLQITGDNEVIFEYGMKNATSQRYEQEKKPTEDAISDAEITLEKARAYMFKSGKYANNRLYEVANKDIGYLENLKSNEKVSAFLKKAITLVLDDINQQLADELQPIDTDGLPF